MNDLEEQTSADPSACQPIVSHPPLENIYDAVRILHLLPAQDEHSLIRCKLSSTRLMHWNKRFTAVSYVWGPSEPMHIILVNNVPFYIRQNLYDFLLILRQRCPEYGKRVWIDAICIDQYSIAERNHQVQQIGEIYRRAKSVFAWLGRDDQGDDALFKQMNQDPLAITLSSLNQVRTIDAPGERLLHPAERESQLTPRVLVSLGRLLENDYWTRTWILQEVTLARQGFFVRGTLAMNFRTMKIWLQIVHEKHRSLFLNAPHFGEAMADNAFQFCSFSYRDRQSFDLLFLKYAPLCCTIPHDKVYGLLGLLHPPSTASIFTVDYSKTDGEVLLEMLPQVFHEGILSRVTLRAVIQSISC